MSLDDTSRAPALYNTSQTHRMRLRPLRLPHPGRLLITLLMMSCLGLTLPACVSITHQPASHLRMAIVLAHQYAGDQPLVNVSIQLYEHDQRFVMAPENARFSCNGETMTYPYTCPRQAPGGAYQIGYTDEHGATTIVTVPVPIGEFALVAPRPDTSATLPTVGALTLRLATPALPPGGSVRVDHVVLWCGYSTGQGTCGVVSETLVEAGTAPPASTSSPTNETRQQATPLLGAGTPTSPPTGPAVAPRATRTLTPDVPPGHSCSTTHPTVATITQRDSEDEIVVDSDYSCWPPAPGEIDLSVRVQTRPAPNGFLGVSTAFVDELSYAVIWAR